MESRTEEWFALAMERELHKNLQGVDVGNEVRSLAREDNPVATLKAWESHDMLAAIHPSLPRRKPDYDSLNKLARVRGNLMESGLRPRLNVPVMYYTLGRLKDREAATAMRNMELRAPEIKEVDELVGHAQKVVQDLKGRKTNAPKDASILFGVRAAGDDCVHRSGDAEPEGVVENPELPAEMAPAAAGTSGGRAGCSGNTARTEVRHNYRGAFSNCNCAEEGAIRKVA